MHQLDVDVDYQRMEKKYQELLLKIHDQEHE